jgi:hypothetical protein
MLNIIQKKLNESSAISLIALLISLENGKATPLLDIDLEPTPYTMISYNSQRANSFSENEPTHLARERSSVPTLQIKPIRDEAINQVAEESNANTNTVSIVREEEREQSTSYLPLIMEKEDGAKTVSPFLRDYQDTLLQMNDLSYSLVKGYVKLSNEQMENLMDEGWKITGFTGLEGENSTFGDLSGIICYNQKKSLMTVVYHGTATIDDGVRAGWETNLDAMPVDAHTLGLNIPGKVHKGFAKKYVSTKDDVLGIIKQLMARMSAKEKENLRIVFTGHSQAGGVGNLALYDIVANHGKELFHEGFENSEDSRFYGYFLSVPRVGDRDYVDAVHSKVGKDYLIRQNVHGDPVTIGLGNKTLGRTLGLFVPYFKRISVYEDSGYLLLDTGSKAWKRINNLTLKEETKKYRKQLFYRFLNEQKEVLKYAINPVPLAKEVVQKTRGTNIILKTPGALWALTKGIGKRALNTPIPGLKALKDLIVDSLTTRFAHYHYGFNHRDGRGAVFDPKVVSRDWDTMLKKGMDKRHN